jgi:hypothetical protein
MPVPPMMAVNYKGLPIGQSVERVIFPSESRVGEAISAEYDPMGMVTAIFFLEWTVSGGAGNLDLIIEARRPVNKQWVEYISFVGALTAPGLVLCIFDPLAVQADFDPIKAKVKRARLPGVCRVRVKPSTGLANTYSLGVVAGPML